MTTDALHPSPALLAKLGSLVVHADEYLTPGGTYHDRAAFEALLQDAEVRGWLVEMHGNSLIPRKRSHKVGGL